MAEPTNNAAPFMPQATAASQRMADSVFDRLNAGGRAGRADAAPPAATAKSRTSELPLQTAAPRSRPQKARDLLATEPKERAPAAAEAPSFPTVATSWEPPEVARAGLRARETAEAERPLWSVLPAVQVEPILTAVETALRTGPTAPAMPQVLPPASSGGGDTGDHGDSSGLSRSTIDASLRMLDALRAHATMHATAGDQRISLGDMTLIAFAEKKQQMAAALANDVPEPKEPDRPVGNLQHPKVNTNKNMLLQKIKEVAEEIFKKEEENERLADIRHGSK